MARIEFFYDVSSPWTYFAFERIGPFCAKNGADLVWKPILVGGVFNKVNRSVYDRRENPVPPKDDYYRKDMADWARYLGIEIIRPSVFPVNSVKALRGAFVAIDEGRVEDYSRACFEAYWRDDRDISQEDVLRDIVTAVGMDADSFFERIADEAVKKRLFDTTDELIRRGGFGSPTFFIDGDDMYFGNDRLELMQASLDAKKAG
ncbi:MAG: 2-hydroxychromene-2-carboxylate isomerase [Alphaproteobacteria bacterium]|jgi:2-hydroxychromene-2-carboxylate isomerase|nr:2-hydroxychromene-2-carboxylate isomerase [Alphaproteobacteria bacterium]